MDNIFKFQQILNNNPNIVKVKNFYYENHECSDQHKLIKINLDIMLKDNMSDEVNVMGYCRHCNTLFYNKDYSSKKL